jgi:hypothetical protein
MCELCLRLPQRLFRTLAFLDVESQAPGGSDLPKIGLDRERSTP